MTKTAKILPITPTTRVQKPLKPLTAKQYARMLTDRTEELADIFLTRSEEEDRLSENVMAELRQVLEDNYLADKGLDAPPC